MKAGRLTLLLLLTFLVVASAGSAPARAQVGAGCRAFPETGQIGCASFLQYWDAHGGLAQLGYPISGELTEPSEVDGKTYTVQYFERAVLELHPENRPPYDVLQTLLGAKFLRQRYPAGAPEGAPASGPGVQFFPVTGKTLGGVFLDYWNTHGGLMQQGYPITNEFPERSAVDGRTYTVQYFERAVFELHPENKPPYNVLLSQLGTMQFKQRHPAGAPAPTPPAGDEWIALRSRPLRLPDYTPGAPCPADHAAEVNPDFGLALGAGPVYPVGFSADGVFDYTGTTRGGPWYYLKVLWISDPSYSGPVLVRGRQLGGPNDIRFGKGVEPSSELRLSSSDAGANPSGWRNWPTYTRLRSTGCYAYQVDGTGFSNVLVFRAIMRVP